MELKEILPFIIPGILFQLSMQVFYIKKCLKDSSLTPAKRCIYSVMIAVFSLPAAAVYLFKSTWESPADIAPNKIDNVVPNIRRGIFLLLVTAYEVMGMHMLAENTGAPMYNPLIILLTLSFLMMALYNLLPAKNRFTFSSLLPVLQLMLCVPLLYLDISGDNLYLALIAGISAINHAPMPQAKAYGISALGAYLTGSTIKMLLLSDALEIDRIVQYFFVNTLVVLLALVAFYTLKKQMVTSVRLEAALNKLKVQSEQLKGLAVVEERNRMAAEMHDTVGHTLTAAVLTLEAAEGLVSEPLAAQKLHQGKEQVRRGLAKLRASVKVVRAGNEAVFADALDKLLQEIRLDTGFDIHVVSESEIDLTPLQAGILLSAVKECVTNAIRHGHATGADILIGEHNGQLRLTFTDNGSGTDDIKFGSGLSIMRERMQSVGGTLEIESAPGEGFTISLIIPIVQRKEDAQ
jgi:signal transduction histidine kinase